MATGVYDELPWGRQKKQNTYHKVKLLIHGSSTLDSINIMLSLERTDQQAMVPQLG